jgi:hypothetical protein
VITLSVCPLNFFVFYAISVVLYETRQPVLLRSSCVHYEMALLSVYMFVTPFHFLFGPCHIKGKQANSSSQNL